MPASIKMRDGFEPLRATVTSSPAIWNVPLKVCSISAFFRNRSLASQSAPSRNCTSSTKLVLPALLRVLPSVEPDARVDTTAFRPGRNFNGLNVGRLLLTERITTRRFRAK